VDPAACDAALVVSELLSNAIRHARPLPGSMLQVAWVLMDGWIEVSVSDGGATTRPHPARPSRFSLGGRGLAIVKHLSSSWGVRTSEGGTTVWAVLPAPRAGPLRGMPPRARHNGQPDKRATASPTGR